MTPEEDLIHLRNIIRSALEIEGYTKGQDFEAFAANESARTAVAMNLSMIGNEAYLLSDDFKNQYDELDIRVLENLKNANYNEEMEIFQNQVWNVVIKDLPVIREKLSDIESRIEPEKDIKGTTQNTTRNNLK